ncbi:MAG: HigA family addiction module antidote protein [Prolixibacteraceae bacterium]|jgi:HTH-type transcriptional regulator/antitoxin HigA|nr:HigA family addiction module antidote protein [Prolixibacteraceae bacterium]
MTTKNMIPFEATHPGTVILDEISARNISQKELAHELGVLPSFLNEILKGKRAITADFAILLEKSLGISANYWMRFQSQYDIDKAKLKEKNIRKIELIETWKIIKDYVPVNQLKKLGYLIGTLEEDIQKIKNIYKVETIDNLVNTVAEHRTLSFYRKSEKLQINQVNMLAWSKIAEYESDKITVTDFKASKIEQLKSELQKIFFENFDVKDRTKKLLENFGIKLVYLNKFDKTPIDGFSFWSGNNPTIALSVRHKRIDNFAFTVLHEIGHIELHLKDDKERRFVDIIGSKDKDDFELQADEYAQKSLITDSQWNELVDFYTPLNDDKIFEYGAKHKIHPAIILGRACWEMNYYAIKSKIDKTLN